MCAVGYEVDFARGTVSRPRGCRLESALPSYGTAEEHMKSNGNYDNGAKPVSVLNGEFAERVRLNQENLRAALKPPRGHKTDWDFFASETGDSAWSYESVLEIYHRIEDWHGEPDPKYRDRKSV